MLSQIYSKSNHFKQTNNLKVKGGYVVFKVQYTVSVMIFNISYTEAVTQPAASSATIGTSSSSKTSVTETIVAVLSVMMMGVSIFFIRRWHSFFSEYGD